jgi:type III secretion protein D
MSYVDRAANTGRIVMSALAKLQVLSGRHTGAVKALMLGEVSIGSSLAADIVLTDPSVAPIHARLSCGRFRLELEAVDGGVLLGNRKLVGGDRIASGYPARFFLGDVEAGCCRLHESRPFEAFLNPRVLSTAFAILLLCAASWNVLFSNSRSSQDRQQPINQTAAEPRRSQPADVRPKPEALQAAAVALQEHLSSAGIHSIDVSAEQGVVIAKGFVTQTAESAWRTVQIWFDGSFGQEVMLKSEVTVSAPKIQNAPIGIQAVWAGKRPYLIDDHGDKYFEGSFLKDGWVVEKIEEGRVLLRRNQELLSLEL